MADMAMDEIRGWFNGRIPDDWFTGPVDVTGDREELLIRGELADAKADPKASDAERAAARASRVDDFREQTRPARMRIAADAEHRFGRKVSWAVTIGGETRAFTVASVPVMTRLRMRERAVLDTLVDAGVARSRSDALAWCVRLVADNEAAWIEKLRGALGSVEAVRGEGPKPGGTPSGRTH
ncbi:MAG TPA: hypothetical protein VFP19_08775 [Candidatus Limnocylindrales bacterium]|nr:hypothetical protein [Candidatus Limnocylindrales bacterium]